MANLKFARGTTTPTYSTSGFDDGCIYFNTLNQNIYLRNGTSSSPSTVEIFKGTDTNNIPIYTSTGGSSFVPKAFANIQSVPTDHATATQGASSLTWYNWVGQGVVNHSTFAYDVYTAEDPDDWETAMSRYTSVPPISNAKEIVVAVSPYYLAYHANGGTNGTNMSILPTESVVIRCYRTTQDPCPNEDPSSGDPSTTDALFKGRTTGITGYTSSSADGKAVKFYEIQLGLCHQAGNAISASINGFHIKGGSNTNIGISVSADSGDYSGEVTIHTNIEKYVYPLFIRY